MREAALRQIAEKLDIKILSKDRKGWMLAKCPFAAELHDGGVDHNPSFFMKINDEGVSAYHCFTCGQKGRVSSLVSSVARMREEDLTHIKNEAILADIPSEFGEFEITYDKLVEREPINSAVYFNLYPSVVNNNKCIAYLKSRHVSRKAAEKANLRYDEEQNRILFPVHDARGELYGFSGRSLDESYSPKNPRVRDYAGLIKSQSLLGEEHIDESKPFLVVEGLFAYARMLTIGADETHNIVATFGCNMSEEQRDIVVEYDRPVYMLYDNDFAGDKGMFGQWSEKQEKFLGGGAIDLLREHVPTYACIYPKGIDDPDNLERCHIERMVKDKNVKY